MQYLTSMAHLEKKNLTLADGTKVFVQSAEPEHAPWFKEFNDVIFSESDYLYPATKREKSLEECRQQIIMMKQSGDLMLMIHNEKAALGILNLRRLPQEPVSHSVDFGVAVRSQWRGKGVASLLMTEVFEFAKADPTIRRIQMSVVAENKPAIDMYSKLGFEVEGRRKLAVKSGDGKFYDELLMARVIS